MEFMINTIGIVAIDVMAMLCCELFNKNPFWAFILLLIGNCVGGLLYKFRKEGD